MRLAVGPMPVSLLCNPVLSVCNVQLACKSDREFRACEIAGLMLDEHSVSPAAPCLYTTVRYIIVYHVSVSLNISMITCPP